MGPTRGHVLIVEDEVLVALEIEARLPDIGFGPSRRRTRRSWRSSGRPRVGRI
ncbi:MAG: hypothetical protein Q8S13_02160 [Dehalococcoidia bacterium]|nr:hypothetical protein [Dehalococcoidia bacterium]